MQSRRPPFLHNESARLHFSASRIAPIPRHRPNASITGASFASTMHPSSIYPEHITAPPIVAHGEVRRSVLSAIPHSRSRNSLRWLRVKILHKTSEIFDEFVFCSIGHVIGMPLALATPTMRPNDTDVFIRRNIAMHTTHAFHSANATSPRIGGGCCAARRRFVAADCCCRL